MRTSLVEWWPTIWMSGVYVAAWVVIVVLAAKALTNGGRRRPR